MGDVPRAPIGRWRRIQLTKHLIEQRDLPRQAIEFDEAGTLRRVRASRTLIAACVQEGAAFMTNGCPDRNGRLACNRPFGSYRPGEEFRDYPFVPVEDDQPIIRQQLAVEDLIR